MPQRVQRKRTRGWKMPEETIYVGRPTKWGNPYKLNEWTKISGGRVYIKNLNGTIDWYRDHLMNMLRNSGQTKKEFFKEIREKNLACWCPPDQLCHADILLKIANS